MSVRHLILIAGLALGMGCAATPPPVTPAATPPTAGAAAAWPQAYTDAINDALNPEPGEIVTNLVAIVPDNPRLRWRQFPDGQRVLVVSLVGNTSFYPPPGSPYNTGARDAWVTAVPEMRDACTQPGFNRGDLAMRLRQVFGLTPIARVAAFVEFWVLPAQLFRPAADNEITDTTAGLTMPATTEPWYRAWFNQLRARQYFQSTDPPHDAYPWTQLGYTYDWGDANHQGASEFVIRQQSPVVVDSITPYQAYCAAG